MDRYWFRPHRYGLGATPKTWEGWAVIAAYVVALGVGAYLMKAPLLAGGGDQPLAFTVFVFVLTTVLLVVCWRTTEGGWRWRWGKED